MWFQLVFMRDSKVRAQKVCRRTTTARSLDTAPRRRIHRFIARHSRHLDLAQNFEKAGVHDWYKF